MKTSQNTINKQNKQGFSKMPMLEIRDNLDSREREEQHVKGNDITNNKKQGKSK